MKTVDGTEWVVSLSAPDVEAAHVGMKAASLGGLLRAGFPVPDGFVVTTAAFLGAGAGGAAEAKVPPEMAEAIAAAATRLAGAVAVRSSGVAEDLAGASHAGLYETFLDVEGADAVVGAVARCWASASSGRVAAYRAAVSVGAAPLAVLVQRMVKPRASGVAFTADPITGDRAVTRVSAVRGLGERLVSGAADADEWEVRNQAILVHRAEGAIDAAQALAVAELARRVEAHAGGVPQDVEWAIDEDGALRLLQARAITALPESVTWEAPHPGGWSRYFRFGEWLCEPLTPLFADWGLPRLEDAFWRALTRETGLPAPRPTHVLVHGWYFGSLGFWPDSLPRALLVLLRRPRMLRVFAQSVPALVDRATRPWERAWRDAGRPAILAAVADADADAERQLASAAPDALPELAHLMERLLDAAGDYFVWLALLAGVGYKTEIPLGDFYRRHLAPALGGSHQELLIGLGAVEAIGAHAVVSLDWAHPTLAADAVAEAVRAAGEKRGELEARRSAAEARARAALRGRKRRRFERLLEQAQRYARLREEVVSAFTAGWPALRRAVLGLGRALVARGAVAREDDVFYLTREELHAALAGAATALAPTVAARRQTWQRQRRLTPPLQLGVAPAIWRTGQKVMSRGIRGAADGAALPEGACAGIPAAPGLATGPARIVRGPEEFHRLAAGDVLIAPATAPAWTPLFTRAAAVVTDTGSPMAHASLVAREYGIPAVVAAADATRRFRDGELVTVDGHAGIVYPAR